jgi:hypothetical protein
LIAVVVVVKRERWEAREKKKKQHKNKLWRFYYSHREFGARPISWDNISMWSVHAIYQRVAIKKMYMIGT